MWIALVLALALGAAPTMKDLTFLTRDGCVNMPDMMLAADDALTALGWPHDYQVIDIGKLRASDVRTGYPTPTLLWKGKDIFEGTQLALLSVLGSLGPCNQSAIGERFALDKTTLSRT